MVLSLLRFGKPLRLLPLLFVLAQLAEHVVSQEISFGVRFHPTGDWITKEYHTPARNGRTLDFVTDCDATCCKARCEELGAKCRSILSKGDLCYLKDVCVFEGATFSTSSWSVSYRSCESKNEVCDVSWETYIGNGYCDDFRNEGYNSAACAWDGGDCCAETCTEGQYYCKKGYGYRCRNLEAKSGKAWDSASFLPGMFKARKR